MSRLNIWIVLLLVSVLINGVLIGAGARTWLASDQAGIAERTVEPPRGFDLRAFIGALPEDARVQARRMAMAERRALAEELGAMRRARRAAHRALIAEPFDPETAQQALDDAREARMVVDRRTEALILTIAAELSEDDRRQALSVALRGSRRPHPDDRDDRRAPQ